MAVSKKKVTKKKVTKKKVTKKHVKTESPPKELRRLKSLTKEQVQALLVRHLDCNLSELMKLKKDPETSAMELIVIGVIIKAIKDGDPKRLDFLLDRIIGKVKNELEVTGSIHDKLMDMIEKKIK